MCLAAALQEKSDGQKGGGGGMFKGLIDTIIGNLQLSISNIHVRYEVRHSSCPSCICIISPSPDVELELHACFCSCLCADKDSPKRIN